MKGILGILKDKWPEYLIEAIVIVASILGAFALDNWNENLRENEKERDYILRFIEDLKRDTTNFSIELVNTESKHSEGLAAYRFVTDDSYLIHDTTLFLIQLQDIGRTNKPRFHKNTYADLVSTGTSSLIRDKEVLDAILTYYSGIPTEWFDEEYLDRMWKGYLPKAIEALDLEFLETTLNQDKAALEITEIKYDIEVSEENALEMLKKFKNIPDIEFQTKNITRTHLVHKLFLTNIKARASNLLQQLESYSKTLDN